MAIFLEINNHFWWQFPLIVIYHHQKSRAELSKSSRSMIYCCRQKDGDCEWAERTISHSHGEIHSHMYNETVCISHGESQTQSVFWRWFSSSSNFTATQWDTFLHLTWWIFIKFHSHIVRQFFGIFLILHGNFTVTRWDSFVCTSHCNFEIMTSQCNKWGFWHDPRGIYADW